MIGVPFSQSSLFGITGMLPKRKFEIFATNDVQHGILYRITRQFAEKAAYDIVKFLAGAVLGAFAVYQLLL